MVNIAEMHPVNLRKMYFENPKPDSLPIGFATEFSVYLNPGMANGGRSYGIKYSGNEIATISDFQVTVRNCGWHTNSTAVRIRKILTDNRITEYTVKTRNGKHHLFRITARGMDDLGEFERATFTMVAGLWIMDYFGKPKSE